MKKLLLFSLLITFLIANSLAQPHAVPAVKTDKRLTSQIQEAIKGFRGEVGVYVRHLKTNKIVEINADTLFPTASLIKVPIQCGLFDKIVKGQLNYNATLTYKDSLHYDDGIVGSLKDGTKIPLSEVVMLMETVSDNTGSLWCQALAGGGKAINEWMAANGFEATRVNSRTPGREPNRTRYGWGQTTPREMAELMAMIRQGRAISPDASDRMYIRNLARQYWDGEALSQLPPEIRYAAKSGAVNRSPLEVVLVHAPHGSMCLCHYQKQRRPSWTSQNEGYVLLRKISKLLWQYYEPKYKWQPLLILEEMVSRSG
ncbi:MAG: serine hydrolase [Spirosomataceae bacterium]